MNLEEINKVLEMLVGDVKVYMGNTCHSSEEGEYYYMTCFKTSKDAFALTDTMNDIDALIKIAWSLKAKELVLVKTICMDLIGKDVLIDKTHRVTIAAIEGSLNGALIRTTEGRTYSTTNLWIEV